LDEEMMTTLRNLSAAWSLVMFLLFPALTHAETAVEAWVQRYKGTAYRDDRLAAAAVDGDNNVIVTGHSVGATYYDYLTIKYTSTGLPLWTNRYDTPVAGDDRATAMAIDCSNNIIVTGYSSARETPLSPTNFDYATIKYSSVGVPLWTNRYNGPRNTNDYAVAVAVDRNGDVIVTGYSAGTNDLNSTFFDYATVKYSSDGLPLWTNRYSGYILDDRPTAVAVDNSDNVIVTGYSKANSGYPNYLTIKYSNAGVPLWTNRYAGPVNRYAEAYALAVDGSNNVIVTGYSEATSSVYDYTTIKYSSDGVPLWTNRYDGTAHRFDFARAVAVDRSGNVIVTGQSDTFAIWPDPTRADYVTIKYSTDGVPLWTNRYNGAGNYAYDDCGTAVAVDEGGNVVVTGRSMALGPAVYGYATIKYAGAGVPLWTNRHEDRFEEAIPVCLAIDHTDNVVVAGTSQTNASSYYGFTTIKYICVPEPVVTVLQPATGTFQLQVDDVLQPGTLVIEASTNLTDWAPVFTNVAATNVLYYRDPDAGSVPARLYRAFQFP
jgi:uncharacterized delta-60 repeat protein